jgi:hypothetical protein
MDLRELASEIEAIAATLDDAKRRLRRISNAIPETVSSHDQPGDQREKEEEQETAQRRKPRPLPITTNEAGYCEGDKVFIRWDRVVKWGRLLSKAPSTPDEGKEAVLTRVTPKYVYIKIGPSEPRRKASHNVELLQPAPGTEKVIIRSPGKRDVIKTRVFMY